MNQPDYNHQPVVWLWRPTPWRTQAVCDCGWKGNPRLITAAAKQDAWDHAAKTGHTPANPLATWKAAIA